MELEPGAAARRPVTVVSQSLLANRLGVTPPISTSSTVVAGADVAPAFARPQEQAVARLALDVIWSLESSTTELPTIDYLKQPEIQRRIVAEVTARAQPAQLGLVGITDAPSIVRVVEATTGMVVDQTISIPRIIVVPRGAVKSGFRPFALKLDALRYPAVSDELWVQYLRTGGTEVVALGHGGVEEARLEDYIVAGLVDFNDISYDDHADLLYQLAGQAVAHFRSYLTEADARKVLRCYQKPITQFIHAQMQEHYEEDRNVEYEVVVSRSFTALKESAYSVTAGEDPMDFRQSPADKTNMARYLFGGFRRCLYPVQKFQAEQERILAVILDRESQRWFRPAKGQFQIYYRLGSEQPEYQPDFVAEAAGAIHMLEPKARNQLEAPDVVAKAKAAVEWCRHATEWNARHGGKPWRYTLIPHDAIAENMTLAALATQFGQPAGR